MKQTDNTVLKYKNYEINVIRSKRRTVGLEIAQNSEIKLRIPFHTSNSEALGFVKIKEKWIEEHLAKIRAENEKINKNALPHLSDSEVRELAEKAAEDIAFRLQRFAPLVGVNFGRVTIRAQKTRWGSCSPLGNLNFNCLLMLCPDEVRDYVVVHELCHILEMNHSPRFWAEVKRVLPEYKQYVSWLKEHGGEVMRRYHFG